MKIDFRLNTLIFSPAPDGLHTLRRKQIAFLPSLLFLTSCLLSLGLFCLPTLAQVDPTICIDPGGTGVVVVNVTNPPGPGGAPPQTFTATLPTGTTAIANSCTATIGGVAAGVCSVAPGGGSVTWNGSILNNETLTLTYRVQIATTVAPGTTLTINNTATAGLDFPATSSLTVGCLASATPNIRVSDQKPGSVLVFPYYTSAVGGMATNDTRISITNVSALAPTTANQAYVHVFLIDGVSCNQTDFFVCLTPNATLSFTALSYDPNITGYVMAVAVDGATGLPVQNNVLIGNAFVNTPDYFGNYGAESFAANSTNLYADYGTIATLFFDGIGYDPVPKQFAVEIQSPVDVASPFQKIVTAGMIGDLSTGLSGALQTMTAQIFNEEEDSRSVNNILTGTCQGVGTISDSLRVAGKLSNLIKTGMSGTVKLTVGGAVGVLLTPRNTTWGGIRTLHKTATVATSITMPVFIPTCP